MQRLNLLPTVETLALPASQSSLYAAPDQSSRQALILTDLPRAAVQALQLLLPFWRKTGSSFRKIQKAGPIPAEALDALLKLTGKIKAATPADTPGRTFSQHCCSVLSFVQYEKQNREHVYSRHSHASAHSNTVPFCAFIYAFEGKVAHACTMASADPIHQA